MRRIVVSEFLSADGYIVGPNEDMSWVMNNFNEEMGRYAGELMESSSGHNRGYRFLVSSTAEPKHMTVV